MLSGRCGIRPESYHPGSSGASKEAVDAPELWPGNVEAALVPLVKDCLEAEQEAAKAEANSEVIEADVEDDTAPQRIAVDPGQPTMEEVEEHRVTHHPYRSWCKHCVEARGVGAPHKSVAAGNVPIISCDYLIVTKKGVFTRDEAETEQKAEILLKILIVKDSSSRYTGAHVVPVKGLGEDSYAAEKIRRDVLWLGYSRVILKSDPPL